MVSVLLKTALVTAGEVPLHLVFPEGRHLLPTGRLPAPGLQSTGGEVMESWDGAPVHVYLQTTMH